MIPATLKTRADHAGQGDHADRREASGLVGSHTTPQIKLPQRDGNRGAANSRWRHWGFHVLAQDAGPAT